MREGSLLKISPNTVINGGLTIIFSQLKASHNALI